MKTLWARIGMRVSVTDEEYDKMKELIARDTDEASEMISKIFLERGVIYGDSYMPSNYCFGCEDNPNDDELTLM